MSQNLTSINLNCEDLELTWSSNSLFSQYLIELEDMDGVLHSHRDTFSMDFVSFTMLNPFHDLDIPLHTLSTVLLRVAVVLLYLFWPSSTSNQESSSTQASWIPTFRKGQMMRTVPVMEESYDYECFDCTFRCTSREDMNLHSRLCVLGVNILSFTDHNGIE